MHHKGGRAQPKDNIFRLVLSIRVFIGFQISEKKIKTIEDICGSGDSEEINQWTSQGIITEEVVPNSSQVIVGL